MVSFMLLLFRDEESGGVYPESDYAADDVIAYTLKDIGLFGFVQLLLQLGDLLLLLPYHYVERVSHRTKELVLPGLQF